MVRKFGKGLAYIENCVYLDDSLVINYCLFESHDDPSIEYIFEALGANLSRGPGVVIRRAAAHEDPRHAFMRIELWGRLKLYAVVTGREPDGRWLVA